MLSPSCCNCTMVLFKTSVSAVAFLEQHFHWYFAFHYLLLPCRSVHSGHFSRGKASTTLCDDWNSSFAPISDLHWPAELRGVWPRNLEQSTSFATHPRTVAEHLQAPTEDSAFPVPAHDLLSGAVVTDQRVQCRIQIFRLNSTLLHRMMSNVETLQAFSVSAT